jgi:hypothetical protein
MAEANERVVAEALLFPRALSRVELLAAQGYEPITYEDLADEVFFRQSVRQDDPRLGLAEYVVTLPLMPKRLSMRSAQVRGLADREQNPEIDMTDQVMILTADYNFPTLLTRILHKRHGHDGGAMRRISLRSPRPREVRDLIESYRKEGFRWIDSLPSDAPRNNFALRAQQIDDLCDNMLRRYC